MNKYYLEFQIPQIKLETWNECMKNSPFAEIKTTYEGFRSKFPEVEARLKTEKDFLEQIKVIDQVSKLRSMTETRLVEIQMTYYYLQQIYDQGLNDEPAYKSPGKNGMSVELFPNMSPQDKVRKDYFDYFSDIFFQKSYGLLDTNSHFINFIAGFEIPKPDIIAVLRKLRKSTQKSAIRFAGFFDANTTFTLLNQYRNDIVHNFPQTNTWSPFGLTEMGGAVGIGTQPYTGAKTVLSDVYSIAKFLHEYLVSFESYVLADGA